MRMESVMLENHDEPPQTAPETCDRCIARAAFLAVFPGGGELLFCGHHLRVHRERLLSRGAVVWPLPGCVALRAFSDAA
jgi:hypothetical protein